MPDESPEMPASGNRGEANAEESNPAPAAADTAAGWPSAGERGERRLSADEADKAADADKADRTEEPAEIIEWVEETPPLPATAVPAEWELLPAAASAAVSAAPRGPGIPESLGWMGGIFVLQILGGVAGALLAGWFSMQRLAEATGSVDRQVLDPAEAFRKAVRDNPAVIFGVVQLVMMGAVFLAVAWRLGPQRRRLLSFRLPAGRHLLLMLAAILPLSLLAMQLYLVGEKAWDILLRQFPATRVLEKVDSVSSVEELSARTPLFLLVLIVACAPALWEELVFRGTIGRGLTARYGLVGGIGLTSLLFAAMHLNPPHVLALLPLSVFLQVAYLATRSFWAPVLLHFLNNALALLLTQMAEQSRLPVREAARSADASTAPALMIAAAVCVLILLRILWNSRVEFLRPDGTIWTPGYVTAESPPAGVAPRARCRPLSRWEWILAVSALLFFLTAAQWTATH